MVREPDGWNLSTCARGSRLFDFLLRPLKDFRGVAPPLRLLVRVAASDCRAISFAVVSGFVEFVGIVFSEGV